MSSQQPTLKEIARELTISVSTVSRALQNHPSIGHRTRERVQALAEQKGYLPNTAAIGLRTQRKYLVGLVLPTISSLQIADWVNETTRALFERGYLAVVCQWAHPYKQGQSVIRALLSHRVDGLLLYGSEGATSEMVSELAGKAMPFVCVNQTGIRRATPVQQTTDSLLAMIEG